MTVEVTDIGIGGEGIRKVDGYTLFIKDAVIGDTVAVKVMKAKKNYGYARLMRIVKESAFRVSARCPEARRCGGCRDSGVVGNHWRIVNKERCICYARYTRG